MKRVPKNMIVVTRDELKPEKEMSDEELLADAMLSAQQWEMEKKKNKDNN